MVEYRVDDGIGKSPKAEKDAADFRMIAADEASFDTEDSTTGEIRALLEFRTEIRTIGEEKKRSDMG